MTRNALATAAVLAVTAAALAGCGPATTAGTPTGTAPTGSSSAPATTTPGRGASTTTPAPRGAPTTTAAPPAAGGVLPAEDPDHGTAQPFPAAGSCHARPVPNGTLPDPVCTPGATDPHVTQTTLDTTICRAGGYTSTVRPPESVTSRREAVRAALLQRHRPHLHLRARPPRQPRARRLPQQPPQPLARTRWKPQPQGQARGRPARPRLLAPHDPHRRPERDRWRLGHHLPPGDRHRPGGIDRYRSRPSSRPRS